MQPAAVDEVDHAKRDTFTPAKTTAATAARGNSFQWTGPIPVHGECPGVAFDGSIRAITPPDLSFVTAKEAREYFDNTWALTDVLFSCLNTDQVYTQNPYHGLRHPMMFYYGHVTCFYINKMVVAGLLPSSLDKELEDVFEVGVDEMRWDDMSKNEQEWPSLERVREYKRQVYAIVCDLIDKDEELQAGCKVGPTHPLWALFMAIEHEHIHFETSSVLIRELPVNAVTRPEQWPEEHPSLHAAPRTDAPVAGVDYPTNPQLPVAGGTVRLGRLGKPASDAMFGWDNEFGSRAVEVPDFSTAKHMVSNGEFMEFVRAGGYTDKQYWCEDGWEVRRHFNRLAPAFWVPDGPRGSHKYRLRTLFDEVPMAWSWPVDVNKYEARAFCRWKDSQAMQEGAVAYPHRVTAEAEHHLIRDGAGEGNTSLRWGCHSPVDALPASASGHYDVFGNGWQWCEDSFDPLDGFKVHDYYTDFSEPCFDGRHNVIMGGSFISTGNLASPFARYHFRPHFQQHSGFRTTRGAGSAVHTRAGPAADDNVYETAASVEQYLTLHYGKEEDSIIAHEGLPKHAMDFPQRCAQLVLDNWHKPEGSEGTRALDLGCSVGRSALELGRGFDEVVGLDFSQAFVDAAERVRGGERVEFSVPVEGANRETGLVLELPAELSPELRARVSFTKGDACALPEAMGTFDAVLAANLLCRLPKPMDLLTRLPSLVRPNGTVVFTTPFSWLEEFTPKENWLSINENDSFTTMERVMNEGGFRLESRAPMPLLIREHRRKYQYIVSDATVWRKM